MLNILIVGGLGQLTDGKYGTENYRAVGENGIVRGRNLIFTPFVTGTLKHFNNLNFMSIKINLFR